MLNRKDLSKESQKIMCDYDNSILYNDSVLSKIVDYYIKMKMQLLSICQTTRKECLPQE